MMRVRLAPACFAVVVLAGCASAGGAPATASTPAAATGNAGNGASLSQVATPAPAHITLLQSELHDIETVAALQTKSPDASKLTPTQRAQEVHIMSTWQQKYGQPWNNANLPAQISAIKQQLHAAGATASR